MSNRMGTRKQPRPEERSARGSVRSLFADEAEGAAIAAEEWYETERLTGQITGRAPATDRPEPAQHRIPLALEWRHAEVSPSPNRLVRLRRRLERGHRRANATEGHVPVTASRAAPEVASQGLGSREDDGGTAAVASRGRGDPASSARDDAGPRRSERLAWRSPPAAITSARSDRPRLRWIAILGAIALSLAAAATIAIASETGRNSPEGSPAGLLKGASRPTQGPLTMATDRIVLALGIVGREVRASAIVNRAAPIRRHPHLYPIRTGSHSSSRSETVATQKGSTSAPVVSANVPSTSSYRSASSSPAYSSQPSSSGAAVSAPARTASRSASQPAGPTNLGGVVGTNCNPKCR
jgi:hypothetical protein